MLVPVKTNLKGRSINGLLEEQSMV